MLLTGLLKRKLGYNIQFDTSLKWGGDYAYERLKTTMDLLGVKTTDDLDDSNV